MVAAAPCVAAYMTNGAHAGNCCLHASTADDVPSLLVHLVVSAADSSASSYHSACDVHHNMSPVADLLPVAASFARSRHDLHPALLISLMHAPSLRLSFITLLLLLLTSSISCWHLPAGFVDQVDALWDEVEHEVMGDTA
jgi:hypothetical protein